MGLVAHSDRDHLRGRGGDRGSFWSPLCLGTLDPDVGEPFEPLRQVPVDVAHELHRCREQNRPDQGCVDQDRHAKPDAELLHLDVPSKGESSEHSDHDGGRARDLAGGQPDTLGHRLIGRESVVVPFLDAVQQEHVVVHGQAEQDGEEEKRQPCADHPGL